MPARVVSSHTHEVIDPITTIPVQQTIEQVQQCKTCQGSGLLKYRRRRKPRDRRTKYLDFYRRCRRCNGTGDGDDHFTRITHTLKFDLFQQLPSDLLKTDA